MRYEKLFEPYNIGTLHLKNRVVMGPVSTRTGDVQTNWPSQATCDYYEQRAKGGVGMIVIEHTCVTQRGIYGLGVLRAFPEDCVPAWKKLFDSVKKHGCAVVAQLQDGGTSAHPKVNGGLQSVSASSTPDHYKRHFPNEITIEGIQEYKKRYLEAVTNMLNAGVDAIMLHFANGYFLSSFLSTRENKRTDRYGGTIEGRLRLPMEIIDNIRRKHGNNVRLFARIGATEERDGRCLDETKVIAYELEKAGVEAISFNAGSYFEKHVEIPPYQQNPGYIMNDIAELKKGLKMTVMGGGRVTEPLLADQYLREGKVDLIEINRGHIADPEWCNKAQSGQSDSIRRCIACCRCGVHDFGDVGVNCSVNPFAGKESILKVTKAENKKKVLVIGGGPAGLQAAIVATQKGHEVILTEKRLYLGGMAKVAAMPPKKGEIVSLITALAYDAEKEGVKILLNTLADVDFVKKVDPDEVILATGSNPIPANFVKGYEKAGFVFAIDLLSGTGMADMPIGKKFMVLGAGTVGLETAEFIATYENSVDVYEMKDNLDDVINLSREAEWQMFKHTRDLGVKMHLGCKVIAIEDGVVIFEMNGETKKSEKYDYFICSVGLKSERSLEEPLRAAGYNPILIGDADKPARFWEVLTAGVKAANGIN